SAPPRGRSRDRRRSLSARAGPARHRLRAGGSRRRSGSSVRAAGAPTRGHPAGRRCPQGRDYPPERRAPRGSPTAPGRPPRRQMTPRELSLDLEGEAALRAVAVARHDAPDDVVFAGRQRRNVDLEQLAVPGIDPRITLVDPLLGGGLDADGAEEGL